MSLSPETNAPAPRPLRSYQLAMSSHSSLVNNLSSQFSPNSPAPARIASAFLLEDAAGIRVPPRWSFSIGLQPFTCSTGKQSENSEISYSSSGLPEWIEFDSDAVTFSGLAPSQSQEVVIPLACSIGDETAEGSFVIRVIHQLKGPKAQVPSLLALPRNVVFYDLKPIISNLQINEEPLTAAQRKHVDISLPRNDIDWLSYDSGSHQLKGQPSDTLISINTPETLIIPLQFSLDHALPAIIPLNITIMPYPFTRFDYGEIYALTPFTFALRPHLREPEMSSIDVFLDPGSSSSWISFESSTLVLSGTPPAQLPSYSFVRVTFTSTISSFNATSEVRIVVNPSRFSPHVDQASSSQMPSTRRTAIIVLASVAGTLLVFGAFYTLVCCWSGRKKQSHEVNRFGGVPSPKRKRRRRNRNPGEKGSPNERSEPLEKDAASFAGEEKVDGVIESWTKRSTLGKTPLGREGPTLHTRTYSLSRSTSDDPRSPIASPLLPSFSPGQGPPVPGRPVSGLNPVAPAMVRSLAQSRHHDPAHRISITARNSSRCGRDSPQPLEWGEGSVESANYDDGAIDHRYDGLPYPFSTQESHFDRSFGPIHSPQSLGMRASDLPTAYQVSTPESQDGRQASPMVVRISRSPSRMTNTTFTNSSDVHGVPSDLSSIASWDSLDSWEMERRLHYEEPKRRSDFAPGGNSTLQVPPISATGASRRRERVSSNGTGIAEATETATTINSAAKGKRKEVEGPPTQVDIITSPPIGTTLPALRDATHAAAMHDGAMQATMGLYEEEIVFFPRPAGFEPGSGLARSPHLEGLSRFKNGGETYDCT